MSRKRKSATFARRLCGTLVVAVNLQLAGIIVSWDIFGVSMSIDDTFERFGSRRIIFIWPRRDYERCAR